MAVLTDADLDYLANMTDMTNVVPDDGIQTISTSSAETITFPQPTISTDKWVITTNKLPANLEIVIENGIPKLLIDEKEVDGVVEVSIKATPTGVIANIKMRPDNIRVVGDVKIKKEFEKETEKDEETNRMKEIGEQ